MRVKRIIVFILAFILLAGIRDVTFVKASGAEYEIEVLGKEDSSIKHGDSNTYSIEFWVKANHGATVQSFECILAYDTTVFELVSLDGKQTFNRTSGAMEKLNWIQIPEIPNYVYQPPTMEFNQWSHVLLPDDSKTGFIRMQAFKFPPSSVVPSHTCLQKMRLAFQDGKSIADVTTDTIRFMTDDEMDVSDIDYQVSIAGGDPLYVYEYGKIDGSDTLPELIFVIDKKDMEQYTITVSHGSGGTILESAVPSGEYKEGTVITIEAVPDSGYRFDGWYEGDVFIDADEVYEFTVYKNRKLEARFSPLGSAAYHITVITGEGGKVEGGGTGGTFPEGETVTLHAVADSGYSFDGWYEKGIKIEDEGIFSFQVNADRILEASFTKSSAYMITVIEASGGTVTKTGTGPYEEGSFVELTAIPEEGYRFEGWYEGTKRVNGEGSVYKFQVYRDRVLEARFVEIAADLIVYSTSHPGAYINLTTEEIFLPEGIVVASYSTNKGISWKRKELPAGEEFRKLLDRGMTLYIAQILDVKKYPAGIFVKFPKIEARPKANPEKLVPWYGEDIWNLAKQKTGEAAEKTYEWVKSKNGRTADAGELWADAVNGICSIPIAEPKNKTQYIFRTPAAGDGSLENPYTPSSKIFKVKPMQFAKAPNYKIDLKRNTIRIKNGDRYIIGDGEEQISSGVTMLEVSGLEKGTRIVIWKGYTGLKPASLKKELIVF